MALFIVWICVLSAYYLLYIIVYIKHNIILEMSWTIHNLHYRENHSLCIKWAGDSLWLFIIQLAHFKMATVISHEFLYPWKKRGLTSEKSNPCYSLVTTRSASTWLKKQTRNCYACESLWKPRFMFARAGQVFVVILSKPHIPLLNLSRELWIAEHVLYKLKGASRNFVNPIIGLSEILPRWTLYRSGGSDIDPIHHYMPPFPHAKLLFGILVVFFFCLKISVYAMPKHCGSFSRVEPQKETEGSCLASLQKDIIL